MASCVSCGKSVGFFSKKRTANESGGVDVYCESCFAVLFDAAHPLWDRYDSHLLGVVTDSTSSITAIVYSGRPENGQPTIRSVDLIRRRVLWEQPVGQECYSECYYGQREGKVFFVDPDNDLTVVEAESGAVLWSKRLATKIHSTPRYHVEKGLLVVTSDRRGTYYDLRTGDELGSQPVKTQDAADTLLNECLPTMDYSEGTIVCGEVQLELLGELYATLEIDSGYPREAIKISAQVLEGQPKSLVSEIELKCESRKRTVYDSEGTHEQELMTVGVEGWDFSEFLFVVAERLICWGSSTWGDDTSVGLFVFDPTTLNLERYVPLGTNDNSPDYAYPLGKFMCVTIDAEIDDEDRECVYVIDVESGQNVLTIVDGTFSLAGRTRRSGKL